MAVTTVQKKTTQKSDWLFHAASSKQSLCENLTNNFGSNPTSKLSQLQ